MALLSLVELFKSAVIGAIKLHHDVLRHRNPACDVTSSHNRYICLLKMDEENSANNLPGSDEIVEVMNRFCHV